MIYEILSHQRKEFHNSIEIEWKQLHGFQLFLKNIKIGLLTSLDR
jgi:hypothetical protein